MQQKFAIKIQITCKTGVTKHRSKSTKEKEMEKEKEKEHKLEREG